MLLTRLVQTKTTLMDHLVRDEYYHHHTKVPAMASVSENVVQCDSIAMQRPSMARDRHLWKILKENPFLWSVLPIIAQDSDSLAQLLWIVKSCLFNLIGRFNRSPKHSSTLAFALLQRAHLLMLALVEANWISKQLYKVAEVFEILTCGDVAKLLSAVGQYILDRPPVPMSDEKVRL
ncbi:hypothetical protein SARC_08043 [Sphaeroforma arctica JP610]|uniref:Integrator complex subunit 5 C-terminal domain-containing protein n=1 Tax=Sphaeroforma arctica JP610 TaxID=667725 RepID=A0A0L0FSA1_9EUKA|nr:hypothetical protein SARC_08043 [Sphaeroforma arctica JP610]KNC79569.1 hypothetical protein SARC_08043 [Sphaeroforma arctica JP610]|eukprot:XP_014153471.1 hypothetical protein SARC_08043 [Sphaeroforma arctica JP610]